MNVAFDIENEKFLNKHKQLGYSTKAQMINNAIKVLRCQLAKELRAIKRDEMLANYSPEPVFASLDGEDFAE